MPVPSDCYVSPLQISLYLSGAVRTGDHRLSDGEVGHSELHGEEAAVPSTHLPDQLADEGSKKFSDLFHRAAQGDSLIC